MLASLLKAVSASFSNIKLWFFPSHTPWKQVQDQPVCQGRRTKLDFLEGGGARTLWTCVKTTTIINKYLGEILWGQGNILRLLKVFPINFCIHQGSSCRNYCCGVLKLIFYFFHSFNMYSLELYYNKFFLPSPLIFYSIIYISVKSWVFICSLGL